MRWSLSFAIDLRPEQPDSGGCRPTFGLVGQFLTGHVSKRQDSSSVPAHPDSGTRFRQMPPNPPIDGEGPGQPLAVRIRQRTTGGCRCLHCCRTLRYAVEPWLNSPGFAAVALLTLALGIGANTAIFSFVDGLLLKPLPYKDADRIVRVLEKAAARRPQRHLDAELSRLAEGQRRSSTSWRPRPAAARRSPASAIRCSCAARASRRTTSTSSASRPRSAAPFCPTRISPERTTS